MIATKQITEKPIIFSSEMVRAILEGKKTQTRRVVNPQPIMWDFGGFASAYAFTGKQIIKGVKAIGVENWNKYGDGSLIICPYGRKGTRLWVRESFLPDPPDDGTWSYYDYTDGVLHNYKAIPERFQNKRYVLYKSTSSYKNLKWHTPLFMPRWASRITLEITNIRVERLQEITESGAYLEGVSITEHGCHKHRVEPSERPKGGAACLSTRGGFAIGWDSINGKRKGCDWNSNPFVWVIEFKKL